MRTSKCMHVVVEHRKKSSTLRTKLMMVEIWSSFLACQLQKRGEFAEIRQCTHLVVAVWQRIGPLKYGTKICEVYLLRKGGEMHTLANACMLSLTSGNRGRGARGPQLTRKCRHPVTEVWQGGLRSTD